jgi:hypothetical protein
MTDKPLPPIPTAKIEEALIHLRRPFTPGAVRWKVQVTGPKEAKEKTWATVVGYIDARLVAERLNAVVAGGWTEQESPLEGKPNLMRYRLTVLSQTHTDVGEGQGHSEGMKAKAADSDALKRVAVRFGVGAYLYAMPPFNLYVTPSGEVRDDKPTLARMKSGKAGYLKEPHERWLREAYERWLASDDNRFGEPLDHGDARTGSVGGLAEGMAAPEEDETPEEAQQPLTDEKATKLRKGIDAAYRELAQVNPDRLAPGRSAKMVRDAQHSHEELGRVAKAIENLRDTEKVLDTRRVELFRLIGAKKAKPLIDSAERRGSQQERIESVEKAIAEAKEGGSDG